MNIVLTDTDGYEVLINTDAITAVTVQRGPRPTHYVVTLIDGHNIEVEETPSEINEIELVRYVELNGEDYTLFYDGDEHEPGGLLDIEIDDCK